MNRRVAAQEALTESVIDLPGVSGTAVGLCDGEPCKALRATIESRGTVGRSENHSLPYSPFSSPVCQTSTSERLSGFLTKYSAISSRAFTESRWALVPTFPMSSAPSGRMMVL